MSEKKNSNDLSVLSFEGLTGAILKTNDYFLKQVQKQVNASMTLRNWIIGYCLYEYEQKGHDRAEYGERIYKKLSLRLKECGVKGFSYGALHQCKQFYIIYPQIAEDAKKAFGVNFQCVKPSAIVARSLKGLKPTPSSSLINRLSYSHILELIKQDTSLKRFFYETSAIKNNWSVRELQRAIESRLFERTGQGKEKGSIIEVMQKGSGTAPTDLIRDPYVLEFLNIEEKAPRDEAKLEAAIINHLQSFLLELGNGFCFEARQKRLTIDGDHYRVDLVFYHRVLKCHVLIELKMDTFSPGDVGQMNMYLNYFKDNEMQPGDADPIGIILCTDKSETVARYATAGVSQNLFIAKYLTNLPTIEQLQNFIEQEKAYESQ